MDNNLEIVGNVKQDQKQNAPVFKTQDNESLNSSINSNLNINDYLSRDKNYSKDEKVHSKNGFIETRDLGDRMFEQNRRNDVLLKGAVQKLLEPLEADSVKISGKTAMERIMDAPPFFRFRSFREKHQEDRRAADLKRDYKELYPNERTVPEFDNTTHKFRKNAIRYNKLLNEDFAKEYKKDLDKHYDWDVVKHFIPMYVVKKSLDPNAKQPKITYKRMFENTKEDKDERSYFVLTMTHEDQEQREVQMNEIIKNTLRFDFSAGIANEDYMKTHYLELKRAIDQSIHLKDLLMSTGHGEYESYWDTLSEGMKRMIEIRKNTALEYKELFDLYGKKHHVDAETGGLLGTKNGYKASDFHACKAGYKNKLERDLSELREFARVNRYDDFISKKNKDLSI